MKTYRISNSPSSKICSIKMSGASAKLVKAIAQAELILENLDDKDPVATTLKTMMAEAQQSQKRLDRLIKRADATEENLFKTNKTLETITKSLMRFVPQTVVDVLMKGGADVEQVAEIRRRNLTVFFSDIKGFSTIASRHEPETMARLLMDYFTSMSEICSKYGGTLDQFIGDAMVIFFGDPKTNGTRQDAVSAVEMALEMQDTLTGLRVKWKAEGIAANIHVRMGISTGYCHVGNFGSLTRLHYTAIGNAVNEAARLEEMADPDTIIISADTNALVADAISTEAIGPAALKGRDHPVELFRVTARRDQALSQVISVASDGFNLVVDKDALKDKDAAVAALLDAADQIKKNS